MNETQWWNHHDGQILRVRCKNHNVNSTRRSSWLKGFRCGSANQLSALVLWNRLLPMLVRSSCGEAWCRFLWAARIIPSDKHLWIWTDQKAYQSAWNMESLGLTYGLATIAVSSLCFQCLSVFVSRYATPSVVKTKHLWKWKNISVSWIHSLLTGVWAMMA